MNFEVFLNSFTEYVLFITCLFILASSIYLTIKLRFVQIRFLPSVFKMIKLYFTEQTTEGRYTIAPGKALFTAMSTTLGISTIVGPVIAIHLGGPGALLGYLLIAFFGSAATYAEVKLAIESRKQLPSGVIMGGPMQYIKLLISPFAAKWYAACCLLLMTVWSGAQANQLVAIFDSPLLGDYRIPTVFSGAVTAILVFITLAGGIKRVASISAKIVPIMFVIYLTSSLWIIGSNIEMLGAILNTVIESSFQPYEMATGTLVGGVVSSLRWGILKGTQTSEAGVGTQSIPHSMAETKDAESQAMLAMVSTYTSGIISFLSGCVALITETWQDPSHPLGMSMVAASFEMYFSSFGIVIIAVSALLFAFGTILGNCYNGGQCLGYLTNNKGLLFYFLFSSCMVFLGAITEAKTVWSIIDIVMVFMVVPHLIALILSTLKQPDESSTSDNTVLIKSST